MLVEALLIGIIFGIIHNKIGTQNRKVDLRFTFLPLLAFGLEFLSQILLNAEILFIGPKSWGYTLTVQFGVYGLLLAFIGLNSNVKGIKIFLAGTVMNFIVIVANFGSMPVDGEILKKFGYTNAFNKLLGGQIFAHSVIDESTRLKFLSDIVNITPPYPFPKSISIGDIIMAIGIAVMAATLVSGYNNQEKIDTM